MDDTISRQAAIDVNGLDEEIRCGMCKNPMSTDQGCDGNCKYDEILYEKIIQILNKRITPLPSAQPETHNKRTETHGVCLDAISRQAAIEVADAVWSVTGDKNVAKVWDQIKDLPSAQQDCTECPEYDHEAHSCQTYCDVIRKTLEEAQPERKTGKWIVVDDGCISGKCSVCGWESHMYEDDVVGMDYCPNCGARMEEPEDIPMEYFENGGR